MAAIRSGSIFSVAAFARRYRIAALTSSSRAGNTASPCEPVVDAGHRIAQVEETGGSSGWQLTSLVAGDPTPAVDDHDQRVRLDTRRRQVDVEALRRETGWRRRCRPRTAAVWRATPEASVLGLALQTSARLSLRRRDRAGSGGTAGGDERQRRGDGQDAHPLHRLIRRRGRPPTTEPNDPFPAR